MAGRPCMSEFVPYVASVPFERLAGPYLMADGGVFGFQTHAHHVGKQVQVHPAAIMAFGDFALYALINHHSNGAYASRMPSDEETIVTLTADFELLCDVAVGEMLLVRGHIVRESKRLIVARGVITTGDGRRVAHIGGLWSKTLVPPLTHAPSTADTQIEKITQSFRSRLSADTLPIIIGPQHCNDLAIVHGGCLISLAVLAIDYAMALRGASGQLLTFHADFLAAGRAGQTLDTPVTLFEGRAGVIHADGTIMNVGQHLMAFNAISRVDE
jgi:acyl-coenzyme A thioesterase PaaI-like protein